MPNDNELARLRAELDQLRIELDEARATITALTQRLRADPDPELEHGLQALSNVLRELRGQPRD